MTVPYRWRILGDVYSAPPQGPSHRSFGLSVGGVLASIALFSLSRPHIVRSANVGGISAVPTMAAFVRSTSLAVAAEGYGYVLLRR